jgi:glycerol-3-phosphate cytidylyltransferase/D-beta-D-heptose 7-phosphate kinase/D-beta-D-heptose 1-phosphate adenosyltransferase
MRQTSAGRPPHSVAVVSGFFNPLHVGHLRLMRAARALADQLVVIVNNDRQQLIKKGGIIQTAADRVEIVAALALVDAVFLAVDTDSSVSATLQRVRAAYPDVRIIFANGGDRSDIKSCAERAACERLAIELVGGVGGTGKVDSSSRINRLLGRHDGYRAPETA